MSSHQSLEDVLSLHSDSVGSWSPAKKQTGQYAIVWSNKSAPLTISDAFVKVLIIPLKQQISLLSVIVCVSNVREETFTEL